MWLKGILLWVLKDDLMGKNSSNPSIENIIWEEEDIMLLNFGFLKIID